MYIFVRIEILRILRGKYHRKRKLHHPKEYIINTSREIAYISYEFTVSVAIFAMFDLIDLHRFFDILLKHAICRMPPSVNLNLSLVLTVLAYLFTIAIPLIVPPIVINILERNSLIPFGEKFTNYFLLALFAVMIYEFLKYTYILLMYNFYVDAYVLLADHVVMTMFAGSFTLRRS